MKGRPSMRRNRFLTVSTLTVPLLVCLMFAQSASARGPRRLAKARGQASCSGQPKDCKLPSRYLGEKDGCACFTCEYGKKTQRVICTNNTRDKESLRLKVRQSTPKKPS